MHSHSYEAGYHNQRSPSRSSTTSTASRGSQGRTEKKHTRKSSNSLSSTLLRGRSRSSMPVEIHKSCTRQSSTSSQSGDTTRSAPNHSYFDQDHRSTSPAQMSSVASSSRPPKSQFTRRVPTPARQNSDDYRRYSGTVNHCGRHSNDWLFGRFSVRETVRDGFEKLRHSGKES